MIKKISLFLIIALSGSQLLFAEESFVMAKRQWKEVYSIGERQPAVKPVDFPNVGKIKSGNAGIYSGEYVEIRGFFEAESEKSFRLVREDFALPTFCTSCIKRAAQEHPRIMAPPAVIRGLKPGLTLVRGKAKVYLDRLDSSDPIVEIEAGSISVPE